MRVSEYDAFGPWVYMIDEDHPLPSLFAPCVEHPEAYRMLFKIPRNIERRVATPDMDLYDHVVGVDDSAICIWSRAEKTVESVTIPLREVTGVRLYQRFLHGVCTVYSQAGEISVGYNTASSEVLWQFLELLRTEYPGENAAPAGLPEGAGPREENVEIWLYNQMRDLRERGIPFRLDASQSCWSAVKTGRRFPWTKPEEFAGTLYLHNDREFLLLRSGKPEKKGEQKYSAEFTSIPWAALQGVSVTESAGHEGCVLADFRLPGGVLRTEIPSANSDALRFLKELASCIHP